MNLSPAAARYPAFLAEHFPAPASTFAEPLLVPEREPDELAWQSRWFAGDFGREFLTTTGESVIITDFGWWNHGAGPDFRECVVSLSGESRRGSIELDRDARDWDHHGHSTNPAYGDTVLHLQLGNRASGEWFTRTADHRLVPQVRLDLSAATADFHEPPPAPAHPGRCLQVFRRKGNCTACARVCDGAYCDRHNPAGARRSGRHFHRRGAGRHGGSSDRRCDRRR